MAHVVKRLRITGRVQGVGYRYAFVAEAKRLGLRGWVANRVDGSVEAMVAGESASVDAIAAWSRRGPPAAKVAAVQEEPSEGDFESFAIAPSF